MSNKDGGFILSESILALTKLYIVKITNIHKLK